MKEILESIKKELNNLKPRDGILEDIKKECLALNAAKKVKPLKTAHAQKNRRRFGMFMSAAAVAFVFIFIGAMIPFWIQKPELSGTAGLKYNLVDNDFYEVSIGEATDKNIVIASEYKKLPVQRIARNGFMDTEIASVEMPDTITSIEGSEMAGEVNEGAFYGCNSLTEVIFSSELKYIGAGAFTGCTALESIVIPAGVTDIGDSAFSGSGLTSITIPRSVVNMGSKVFEDCDTLIAIYTEASTDGWEEGWNGDISVMHVDENGLAFTFDNGSYEISLGTATDTDIIIPDTYNDLPVTAIADSAFKNYTKLISIRIPENITYIKDYAFAGCSGLTNISLPESIERIGNCAFMGCSSLTSIIVPKNVENMGSKVFEGCENLTAIYTEAITGGWVDDWNSDIRVISIDGNGLAFTSIGGSGFEVSLGIAADANIVIPDMYKGLPVTAVADGAFKDYTGLKSITMPANITYIGEYAFANCSNLSRVAINGRLRNIGNFAFYFCSGLTDISLPKSIESIGDYAFTGCSGLTSIKLPSINIIGTNIFAYCSNLTDIIIPDSVEILGVGAFVDCVNLSNVVIPNSVKAINDAAFSGCTSLTRITIPESVVSLGSGVFKGCINLTIYAEFSNKPDGWADDWNGDAVFVWREIKTPYLNFIFLEKEGGFEVSLNDRTVTEVVIPATHEGWPVKSIADNAFRQTGIVSVKIPESVTRIGDMAFYLCIYLENIVLPRNIVSIGTEAFLQCSSLKSITIPESVIYIGNRMSQFASNLTIYVEAQKRPSGWSGNWNDENRPVVWMCKLSEDEAYVESFKKSVNFPDSINDPYRYGYTFKGWALVEGDPKTIQEILEGLREETILYAIWEKN